MGNRFQMKFITLIVASLAISTIFAAQGTPAATSYCMGNVDNATTCSSCFNWGSGTVGARNLVTAACTTKVTNAITDCKYYSGLSTATKAAHDCGVCDSKTWLNVADNATNASIVITCSDTAINTTTCASAVSN